MTHLIARSATVKMAIVLAVATAMLVGLLATAPDQAQARPRYYTNAPYGQNRVPYVQNGGQWVPLTSLPAGTGPYYDRNGQGYWVPGGQMPANVPQYQGPYGGQYNVPRTVPILPGDVNTSTGNSWTNPQTSPILRNGRK